MRSATMGNCFPSALVLRRETDGGRGVLVALVQSVVSAFDEYFSPLDEAGGQETGDHANDDFLYKCRLHLPLQEAEEVPWRGLPSPEAPLAGFHDPEAEQKIRHRMCEHARSKIFCPISNAIIKCSGDQGGDPVL